MRTQHPRARAALVACIAATALAVAACSDANEIADIDPIGPPATPTISDREASSTTVITATTATDPTGTTGTTGTPAASGTSVDGQSTPGVSSTSVDGGLTGPRFSDALGTQVDTAPGVRTRGDTRQLLDAGLWVHIAWEPDPQDPSVFTVQPDDIPILEAYANAVATYYRAATTTLTTDDPDFARYIVDAEAMFGKAFAQALDGGYVLDLGVGVVLRPYVVDRSADDAVVYDCYLQDQLYVVRNTGREPRGLSPLGQVVTLDLVGGLWLANTAAELAGACL